MDEITKTCLELVERLKNRKSVFVEHRYSSVFCEICRDLHIPVEGGIITADSQCFYI